MKEQVNNPTSSSVILSITCAMAFVITHLYTASEKQGYISKIKELEQRIAIILNKGNYSGLGGEAALSSEIKCLADNVYHEARSESYAGQLGVATVTLNRVLSPYFPDTVCAVVWQGNSRGCQFSWTCDGLSDEIHNREAYLKAMQVAEDSLVDGIRSSEVNTALFYHATSITPVWANDDSIKKISTIDRHIFYAANY